MTGRRVKTIGELERPGDYSLRFTEGKISGLWMNLPRTGTRGRIAATGFGTDGEPEWEIRLEADGTVTVSPSIDEGDGGYHGFLSAGVWTEG